MALAATVQWDVRTGGSDTNGGAFDPNVASPGTDYSQQNSAQVAFTDLVIGATNTQLTSAAHPFTSAHVGNIINITSGTGFTTGRYEILSVSGSTATMDRAVGTASSTGGNGNLGGSLATVLTALNQAYSSNTIWVQSGTYTVTAIGNVTNTFVGVAGWIYTQGYGSTHGDLGTAPLITTATNSVDIFRFNPSNTAYFSFWNMSFSNTAGTRANCMQQYVGNTALALTLDKCSFDGFASAINGDNNGSHGIWQFLNIYNTLVKNCTSGSVESINNQGGSTWIVNSTVTNGAFNALNFAGGTGTQLNVVGCLIYGNSGYGLTMTGSDNLTLLNNTWFANTSGGVFINTGVNGVSTRAQGNIFYGNGSYGFQGTSGNPVSFWDYNAYGGNTTGNLHNQSAGVHDETLTANPFVASGSGNFALNTTAGGGALCKQAGFGAFPGGLSTGYPDIGAVQSSSGGSSGGLIVNPGMQGGCRG